MQPTVSERAAFEWLSAAALVAAGCTTREEADARNAILWRVQHDNSILLDYWPDVARCTDPVRDLISILETLPEVGQWPKGLPETNDSDRQGLGIITEVVVVIV
jgi:hypothetical protein